MTTFSDIIARLENATGPDRDLDRLIAKETGAFEIIEAKNYTASLDAAIALVERILPGWGWRVATCCVSDDAYVFPDFNSPERGQDLLDRLPVCPDGENEWSNFTDVDQRPPGRPAIALLTALFIALEELDRIGQKP